MANAINRNSIEEDIINYHFKYSRNDFTFSTAEFSVADDDHMGKVVENAINSFGVAGNVIGMKTGPVVAKVFFKPDTGVSIKKVETLGDDLAVTLGVKSVKFSLAPERKAIAIEIPVANRQIVPFGNVLNASTDKMALPAAIGVDTDGVPVNIDIAKAPHMLIAGQTGSGKSVCVNSIILSLVLNVQPSMLKLILIDPKMVELTPYKNLPHLIGNRIITDPKEAIASLSWLTKEMDCRYELLAKAGYRNIKDFNAAIHNGTGNNIPSGKAQPMPYIVTVIDEFADLMMTASSELTGYVMRLAQKARAVGIHVILATQRPSVKVVTGDLKSNIPTRIAFKVASATDSVTILGSAGAEKLLGNGDMIITDATGNTTRLHGGYLSDDELNEALDIIDNNNYTDNQFHSFGAMNVDFNEYTDPREFIDGITDPTILDCVAIYRKYCVQTAKNLFSDDTDHVLTMWPYQPTLNRVAADNNISTELAHDLISGISHAEEIFHDVILAK